MSNNGSRDLHYHAGDINIDLNAKLKADLAEARADLTATKAQLEANNQSLETYKIKAEAAADSQQRLNNQIAALRSSLAAAEEGLETLKYETNFDQYAATARRAVAEFKAFLTTVNFSDVEGDWHDDVSLWLEDLENGAMTAGQAIAEFKAEYTSYLNEVSSGGGGLDLQSFQSLLATLEELKNSLESVLEEVRLIREEGVTTVQAQSGVGGVLEQLQQATQGLSEESKEAYDTIIKLVTGLNDYGNIDASKLYAITNAFISLQNIGSGTFSTKTVENIISMAKQLAAVGEAGPITLSLDVSAIDGVKVSKASLKALAENLPEISKADGDQLQKIFAADPTNGINNIKVSKTSLEHLATKLPEITKINSKKLTDILNVNTAGINSLKVSKASVENIANLARAAQILKTNGIDLTLKGSATEEIKKLSQSAVDAADAAKQLESKTADAANGTRTSLKGFEESRDLLGDISLAIKDFDANKLATIDKELAGMGLKDNDRQTVLSVFDGLEGKITSVQAKVKKFEDIGKRVAQVLIKGVDEYGREFTKAVDWKPYKNDDGVFVDVDPYVSATIKYNAAKEQLVNTTKAEADVEERLRQIRKESTAARLNGIGEDNVNYRGVQEYSDALVELLANTDANSTTQKQFDTDLANLETRYRTVTNALKDDIAAEKESAKSKAELVKETEAQAKISREIAKTSTLIEDATKLGTTDENAAVFMDSIRSLHEYIDVLRQLSADIDPATTKQKDFDNTFNEIVASSTDAKLALESNARAVKEDAAAAREAEKAKAELVRATEAQAKVSEEVARANTLLDDATKLGAADGNEVVFNAASQALRIYIDRLNQLSDSIDPATTKQRDFDAAFKELVAGSTNATLALKQNIKAVKEAAKAEKEMNTNLASSAKTRESITAATEKYKRAEASLSDAARKSYASFDTLAKKLAELEGRYKRGDISADEFKKGVADINAELRANTRTLDNTGYGVDGLSMKFGRLAQELGRFLSPFVLARQAWQTLKQMTNVVIELEDAFAQLQIVTGATDKELEEFYSTASDIANNLGKSITDIAKSIEVFSRLGYSLPDATVLAEYATMLSNVASVTTDQATTGLTAIIKGYNMHVEDAEHVSDVLVSIGQKYAVSAGEMMEAYEKAGAALAATNTSFDKSAALIAAANAAVQNSSIVGKVLPMHTVMYV